MNLPKLEQLKQLLAPLLLLGKPDADTRMGLTVGEGLALPSAEAVLQQWPFRAVVKSQISESVVWIGLVLRSEWIVADAAERLGPVSRGVNGQDALVGGWTAGDRTLQIVATQERLHFVTRMAGSLPGQSENEKARRALALAYQLFRVQDKFDPAEWQVRPFGGLTLGNQEHLFAANWPQTLLFLTDGTACKFSVMKIKGRTSPPKRGSATRTYTPWFEYEYKQ